MRITRKKISIAVLQVLNAGVVVSLAAPLAFAQAPVSPVISDIAKALTPAPIQKGEKIEVTGSRIPSLTLTSESPVNVITAEEIRWTGLTSTSDIINQLPQASPGQGNSISNGSSGTATVDLRGLGPQRTLVLIDGRRVPAGSVTNWATDLNAIPAPLIQRVEVLTGGASSVYGSDAVAGVVNFIMNDHFEGVQFDWNGQGYNHNQSSFVAGIVAGRAATNPAQFAVPGNVGLDGKSQDFSMTLGGNFAGGKGNATVYFEYKNVDPVLQAARDYSSCALTGGKTAYTCGGSSTSYPGRFTDFSAYNVTIANAAGGVRNFNSALDQYNFAPINYLQRPDTRYQANFFAHYDALPNVRVFTEFDFMDDRTVAQIAPSGSFLQQFTLLDRNPLLSQAFKDALGITPTTSASPYIGRRNIEGGGRQDDFRHTDYRAVIGAKGTLFQDTWDYNFWWQTGKNVQARTYKNDFSVVRLGRAFDVVTSPTTGQPVCASVVDGTDPACVPYNIFNTGGVTPAALNYLQAPGFQNGFTAQGVVGLNARSDLGQAYGWTLPWAKEGIGVAFGIERRTEKLSQSVDIEFDTGDLAGQGGATHGLSGQYSVKEFYAEARVPIAARQPWAYDLSMTASYRYSDYSTDVTTNSYGIGADWAPVKEGRVRGSYQRAVRAANIIELFTQTGYNLWDGGDPCGASKSATLAQCLTTGLKASQYGSAALDSPAGQFNQLVGGNATLKPETAKTYTVGGVLQPSSNFSATLDYWHYNVQSVIGTVASQQALTNCVNSGVNCDLIHRELSPNGNLWLPNQGYISAQNQNLGSFKTDGIDLTASYTMPIEDYGSLGFTFQGTWVKEFLVEPIPGLGSYDCVGLFGPSCGVPVPKWRHKAQAIWTTPWNVSAALTWRYIDSVDVTYAQSSPFLKGSYSPLDASIGAQSYFDLAVLWNVNKNFSIRAGANNLFDKDPPVVSSNAGAFPSVAGPSVFGNGNTFPQVYDSLGRTLFLNVTAKF